MQMALCKHVFALLFVQISFAARLDISSLAKQDDFKCPSMFAAVFTRRSDVERRSLVRKMWEAGSESWDGLVSKFILCNPPADESADVSKKIEKESSQFGDLLELDCEEGYLQGTLTKKVIASMQAYMTSYDQDYFMKIDDDTFISHKRLCDLFGYRQETGRSNSTYMGVFAEIAAGENMNQGNLVIRDASSPWYEPEENYPRDRFPISAKGGPGYILTREITRQIIENGIAQSHVLNNEDKAVGYWVELVHEDMPEIEYVNIKGTDGYKEHLASVPTTGPWSKYPFLVHHNMTAKSIACMSKVDMARDPNQKINKCFSPQTTARAALRG